MSVMVTLNVSELFPYFISSSMNFLYRFNASLSGRNDSYKGSDLPHVIKHELNQTNNLLARITSVRACVCCM